MSGAHSDPEPQPDDVDDYHAAWQAWHERTLARDDLVTTASVDDMHVRGLSTKIHPTPDCLTLRHDTEGEPS